MKIKRILVVFFMMMCSINLAFANQTESDSNINSAVESKISSDSSLNGTSIKVKTTNGTVNLSGKVDSDTQADTATELAQSTDGVTDVDSSNLDIKGSRHPIDDSVITAKVKGMFIQQKLFGDKDISAMTIKVETNNGIVSLSGTANDQQQIDNAIKISKSIKGVKEVKSTIKVSN
jgi:hyperosmotically inducible protein